MPVTVPLRGRSGVHQFEFGQEMEDDATASEVEAPRGTEVARATISDTASVSAAVGVDVLRAAVVRGAPLKDQAVVGGLQAGENRTEHSQAEGDARRRRDNKRTAFAVGLLAVFIVAGLLLVNRGWFRPVLLKQGEPLLLTVIQNRTEDKTLNGVVIEGLDLLLQQSEYLTVRGGEAYRAGLKQVESEGSTSGSVSSRRIAQLIGAKAYLYGEIKGTSAPYTISVDVLNTESNDKLTSIEELAETREQIPAAISRLASRVRSNMGENDRSIARSNVALEQEASANLDALQLYAMGESARQAGKMLEAITDLSKAKLADPKFAQVHLRLAWLYRGEHAEDAEDSAPQ